LRSWSISRRHADAVFQDLPASERFESLTEGAGTGTPPQCLNMGAETVEEVAQRIAPSVSEYAAAYLELAKPRVLTMVLIATLAGFYMGSGEQFEFVAALNVVIGTALAAGGTLALNEYAERDTDARMERTRHRPLPSGRLRPIDALIFGVVTGVAGLLYLWAKVNPLSAIVTGTIAALYLGAYTPMKRFTWLCQVIGAVPGALPPVIGWAAARNGLGVEPLILFAIMFLWQLPHSLSIARLYERDYARAGIRMLPERGRYGDPANLLMIAAASALLGVGMLPAVMRFAGLLYVSVAIVLGAMLVFHSMRLVLGGPTSAAALRVMKVSLVYLPVVLLAMVLDKV
jgi:heme o synthase